MAPLDHSCKRDMRQNESEPPSDMKNSLKCPAIVSWLAHPLHLQHQFAAFWRSEVFFAMENSKAYYKNVSWHLVARSGLGHSHKPQICKKNLFKQNNLNSSSCILFLPVFHRKHHRSTVCLELPVPLRIPVPCVCPVPRLHSRHISSRHRQFPLNVPEHGTFSFSQTGAETQILHKKSLKIHLEAEERKKGGKEKGLNTILVSTNATHSSGVTKGTLSRWYQLWC